MQSHQLLAECEGSKRRTIWSVVRRMLWEMCGGEGMVMIGGEGPATRESLHPSQHPRQPIGPVPSTEPHRDCHIGDSTFWPGCAVTIASGRDHGRGDVRRDCFEQQPTCSCAPPPSVLPAWPSPSRRHESVVACSIFSSLQSQEGVCWRVENQLTRCSHT